MVHGRSWRARSFGEPKDVLRVEEIEWAEPSAGLVLVKVRACGVGLPDLLITTGNYPPLPDPPAVPGQEVMGEVVGVPAGSAFAVGDRVMGATAFLDGWGGYSDYAYVREAKTQRVPPALTDEEAAGFVIGFRTAYAGLADRIRIAPGEVLLVLGAAGNTGAAAVQLGKALGATVIATASSAEKLAFCSRIGADHVVDHRTADVARAVLEITGGHGADVVFDPVGGTLGTRATAAVARLGRIALIGYASGSWPTLDPLDMVLRSYAAVGVFAGGTDEEDRTAYGRLAELAGRGLIRTPVTTVVSFDDVPDIIGAVPTASPGKAVVRIS
ncbi:zinc-binding dehydrogenase [Pseudonocardia xinjiangensis]